MKINVKRKVSEINLKTSEFLLPLYEVIVNSIQAIEESNIPNGRIKIQINRDKSQKAFEYEGIENGIFPISSFIVDDNGIGFNDINFKSFDDAYSEKKARK
jgi:hypothetical protein